MMVGSRALSWFDLPPELLGLVLKRLPSLADRVRVRLVCKPWHSNARLQPRPPPLPWLTLPNGTFLSIPHGEIHCMPILDDARCYGSVDNWLFLVHRDGKCSLVNPFSKDTLELPNVSTLCGREIDAYSEFTPHELCKLVVLSPLHSSPNSLVAIMHDYSICICQPPVLADAIRQPFPLIHQVLFFEGKLYALDLHERLLILEIGEGIGSMPKISSVECIIDSPNGLSGTPEPLSKDGVYMIKQYLVESSGRLLMVTRWICSMGPQPGPSHDFVGLDRPGAFQVVEADLSARPGRWRRVSELGGQSLFIGSHCPTAPTLFQLENKQSRRGSAADCNRK
ncbi:unnamed protein product [Urochloa humidicola]